MYRFHGHKYILHYKALNAALYSVQKRPKLQGFHITMVPQVLKLATKDTISGLLLFLARDDTAVLFTFLLDLITRGFLGDFLTVFHFLHKLHYNSDIFMP